MPGYRISSRTHGTVEVPASNWLVALGQGLEQLGVVANMDRIACEALPNGTILVRDVRTGDGFIVQSLEGAPPSDERTEEVFASPEDPDDPATAQERMLVPLLTSILQAPSRGAAIQLSLDVAVQLIPAESGAVLLTERRGAMAFAGAFGPEAHKLREIAIPAGTGFAGFCVMRLVSLSIKEPYEDARFCRAIDDITGYHTHSLLVVPIAIERRVFGAFELINASSATGFDDAAMTLLSRVAQALAMRLGASGPVQG